jgi:hypothetical protein
VAKSTKQQHQTTNKHHNKEHSKQHWPIRHQRRNSPLPPTNSPQKERPTTSLPKKNPSTVGHDNYLSVRLYRRGEFPGEIRMWVAIPRFITRWHTIIAEVIVLERQQRGHRDTIQTQTLWTAPCPHWPYDRHHLRNTFVESPIPPRPTVITWWSVSGIRCDGHKDLAGRDGVYLWIF